MGAARRVKFAVCRMLTTLLLTAVLQSSSADDCAILEILTGPQVEAGVIEIRPGDDPGSTAFTGFGTIVRVVDQPAFYASRATFVEGSESASWDEGLTAEQASELIPRIYAWRDEASYAERMESARHRFESERAYLEETLGTLPDGLAESFLSSVAGNRYWSCEGGDFQIVTEAESANTRDSRNTIVTTRATPPGYSSDGNWALVYDTSSVNWPIVTTSDGVERQRLASGGNGFVLLRKEGGAWVVHERANLMSYN